MAKVAFREKPVAACDASDKVPGKPQFRLVEDHRKDGLRAGEGAAVELENGNLLLLYTRVQGGGDASPAHIAQRLSSDGGMNWSESRPVFHPPEGSLNCMSVSLLRLRDGRIGCVFLTKWSLDHLIPMWSCSEDEGRSWTEPCPVSHEKEYFIVNNDRLVQLRDGTLAIPYARHVSLGNDDVRGRFDPAWNADCGLFFSKDLGATWTRSAHTVRHTPDVYREPLHCAVEKLDPIALEIRRNKLGVFQEPGLTELRDGRLMMHMRSLHGIYRCFAEGVERPWTDCDVFEGFHVCCSPQTIKRLPGSDRLIMLYNDRGSTPVGEAAFHLRTPLSVALSDDEGRTWMRWGSLEDETRNYCYFSLMFFGERFLITYYESAETINQDGRTARRSLASLKTCVGNISIFRASLERRF